MPCREEGAGRGTDEKKLCGSSQRPCLYEGLRGKNPQGLTELFALLPPHLDDTPLPSIKGKDAVDS